MSSISEEGSCVIENSSSVIDEESLVASFREGGKAKFVHANAIDEASQIKHLSSKRGTVKDQNLAKDITPKTLQQLADQMDEYFANHASNTKTI
jgi:hypothetical protein